jgi:hypothetical protein
MAYDHDTEEVHETQAVTIDSTPIMSSILLEPFCNAFMGYATHRAWSVGTGLSDLAIVRLVKANSET